MSPSNPTNPAITDDLQWITTFLGIHSLSNPSRRYSFLLWFTVLFLFLLVAILHWTGSRASFFGAHWTRWALRRRTWRKGRSLVVAARTNKPPQPQPLPSNAQLLSLTALVIASFALAFAGPDYIAPTVKIWDFSPRVNPAQEYTQPRYTISKSWWSSAARTGQIAFAMFPLCVVFALKSPPFAIFAIPFMVQVFFDKLMRLHRWAGRLIWLLTALHVILWSVQLATKVRSETGKVAYTYAFLYRPFIYGWIAFGLLTILILSSIHPIRRKYYEIFYFFHVLLVPLTLVFSALHHPTVGWWCWAALALWLGERIWRATWWLHNNGFFRTVSSPTTQLYHAHTNNAWELKHLNPESPQSPMRNHDVPPLSPLTAYYQPQDILGRGYPPPSLFNMSQSTLVVSPPLSSPSSPPLPFIPPAGYAHAEILPGHTIRLRLITQGFLSWAPGQHFLINVPFISRLTSHPFTSASICDEQASGDAGRMIILLIRTKSGWTQDLWNTVNSLTTQGLRHPPNEKPPENALNHMNSGILFRAYVDGPYGSSVRARWGNHSTVVVVAGGSGVSFGLSILQYVCLVLSGRDGHHLGGHLGWGQKRSVTKRIRFIWLVREYSHLQWCATILRQCLSIVPSSALQLDIFITNFKPIAKPLDVPFVQPPPPSHVIPNNGTDALSPPVPRFARDRLPYDAKSMAASLDSLESHNDSDIDLSYFTGDFVEGELEPGDIGLAHRTNILELTNFEGDDDTALPGEEVLSREVKREGTLRRIQSRRDGPRGGVRLVTPTQDQRPRGADPCRPHKQETLSIISSQSTERLIPLSPPSPADRRPVVSEGEAGWASHSSPYQSSMFASQQSLAPKDGFADTHPSSYPPRLGEKLKSNQQEVIDAGVVAEYARPGKPKLDRIIADEMEQSKGSVVVACCGPASLNAMVRKFISAQIDPGRVRRGDMRGSITLVSEEFEY